MVSVLAQHAIRFRVNSVIAHKLKTEPFVQPTTQSQNRPSKFKIALEEPKSLKQTRARGGNIKED